MRSQPQKLKELRDARAFTQEALAAKCGLSRKTVQRMERGETVRAETLAFVAAALGVAVTDFAGPADRPSREHGERQLALRSVRSGKHVFHQLAQTDVGRVECDVDADSNTIGPLTALVSQLQGLVRGRFGLAKPPIGELPLLDRLQAIARLNDALRELETHGVRLFMGHYYRFAVAPAGATPAACRGGPPKPIILTRLHIARCDRERICVPIDREWQGAPDGLGDLGDPGDLLTPAGDAVVFLYPDPPLQQAGDQAGFLEGEFHLVQPGG